MAFTKTTPLLLCLAIGLSAANQRVSLADLINPVKPAQVQAVTLADPTIDLMEDINLMEDIKAPRGVFEILFYPLTKDLLIGYFLDEPLAKLTHILMAVSVTLGVGLFALFGLTTTVKLLVLKMAAGLAGLAVYELGRSLAIA